MASIFKPKGSKKYVILYHDENGDRRKKTGATDKAVTQRLARDLENKVLLRREGLVDTKAEQYRDQGARPLREHLDDWHRDITNKGKTTRHADQYRDRAGKLAALVKGVSLDELVPGRKPEAMERAAKLLDSALSRAYYGDLTSEGIQEALAVLKDKGRSATTANHHRAALRAFLRWSLKRGRIRENPIEGVEPFAEEDSDRPRRALSVEELARLIRSAESGPVRFGMPGPLRAMAYRVAAATGFRVEELRSLTPESFRLDGPEPTVFLKRSSTKNRKPADQPISQALARDIRVWLRNSPSGEPVLPLHHETAKAIKADLEACGVPYETDEGVADFHSLRAYYTSALIRSGATVAEFQKLARHAKAETTLKHYAKVARHDLRGVVEALPSPAAPGPETAVMAATGTDGSRVVGLTATENATDPDDDGDKPNGGQPVASIRGRFAKPLDWETGLGGSNPPLSAPDFLSHMQILGPLETRGFSADTRPTIPLGSDNPRPRASSEPAASIAYERSVTNGHLPSSRAIPNDPDERPTSAWHQNCLQSSALRMMAHPNHRP